MKHTLPFAVVLFSLLIAGCTTGPAQTAVAPGMSFFITSAGPGSGADLDGLAGADAHCQKLAESVGAGAKVWRAYLSTTGEGGVDARDRIGTGPWFNAQGVLIAKNVADLHNNATLLVKSTQLNERGEVVNGRGDSPNRHDILTGSQSDGTAFSRLNDTTCSNWMSGVNGTGSARVGHHDRIGGGQDPSSWNSAHDSRGCSQENLRSTGGDGLFYCFAVD